MRQRHIGSDVERLALITLMLAESRAVGAALCVSQCVNTPSLLPMLTHRPASVWQHSVLLWCVNTAFGLPLRSSMRAADWVEVLGLRYIGRHTWGAVALAPCLPCCVNTAFKHTVATQWVSLVW